MSLDIHIVGSGHSPFGRLDLTLEQLIVDALREALDSAAIPPEEVDALFLGHFNSGLVPDGFPASLMLQAYPGLRFKPATRLENACASGSAAVHAGIAAILSGQARVVVVVGAEKMTHRPTADVTRALAGAGYQNDPAEAALSFPQVFGKVAESYGARYESPLDAMAWIAVKNHENALANPLAQMHRRLTFEQASQVSNANPLIAPPLRLTDCSLISDGAAAIVLTAASEAHRFARTARFRAAVHVNDFLPMTPRDITGFEGPTRAFAQAFDRAGIVLEDVDFAEVHDCFTMAELLTYEAMGLTPKGQGARAIDEGWVLRGGSLPVNLSGGLKAKGHPVGATGVSMHAIAYRQLTGQAGGIQMPGAEIGLVFNMGGAAVANYVSVLETVRA